MSFFGCCSAKKGKNQKLISLDEFTVLKKMDNITKDHMSKEVLSGILKIGKAEDCQFTMYENIFVIIPEKSKGIKDQRYIDINTINTSYASVYDRNYREKDKIEVGIKFVEFDDDYSCDQDKIRSQKSSTKKETTDKNSNEDQSTKNGSAKDNQQFRSKKVTGAEYQKTEIELFIQDKNVLQSIKDHLQKKLQQTEFRWSYKTIEVLGEGSSGTVFNVFNRVSLLQFAAKVVNKQELKKEKFSYEAIMQEIDLMREINSEYVIKMHEVFQDNINLYLVLDLFNGGTLQQKMDQIQYRFKVTDMQQILKQLVMALVDLEKYGIMHRDIKPENILFRKQNNLQLVLCDLGLSTKQDMDKYLFQNVGTPGYVAPEVYYMKGKYTSICDVYSVGVILFQMLFHKLPFEGENVEQILEKNKNNIINYDGLKIQNKVQQYGVDLLYRMLDKDPIKRISAKEILDDKFFTLKMEDEFTKVSENSPNRPKDYTSIRLDVRDPKDQNQQKKEENQIIRNQIQDKYDFTLPKTPLMGKKPLTIENAEMRDKQQSVAESYFFNNNFNQSLNGSQEQDKQLMNITYSPNKEDLLKKTLKNCNSSQDKYKMPTPQSPSNSNSRGGSPDFTAAASPVNNNNSRNKATTQFSPNKQGQETPRSANKERMSQFGRQKSNINQVL